MQRNRSFSPAATTVGVGHGRQASFRWIALLALLAPPAETEHDSLFDTVPSPGSAATACFLRILRPLRYPRRYTSSRACSAWLSQALTHWRALSSSRELLFTPVIAHALVLVRSGTLTGLSRTRRNFSKLPVEISRQTSSDKRSFPGVLAHQVT